MRTSGVRLALTELIRSSCGFLWLSLQWKHQSHRCTKSQHVHRKLLFGWLHETRGASIRTLECSSHSIASLCSLPRRSPVAVSTSLVSSQISIALHHVCFLQSPRNHSSTAMCISRTILAHSHPILPLEKPANHLLSQHTHFAAAGPGYPMLLLIT